MGFGGRGWMRMRISNKNKGLVGFGGILLVFFFFPLCWVLDWRITL